MTTALKPWAHYVDLLKAAADIENALWMPEDPQLRAKLYRQFAMNLSQGYFLYFQSNPDYPDWAPFENSVFLAQPNPDAVYYVAPIDGRGVYRVNGERGNAPVVGFAIGKNLIGMGDPPGPGFHNYDLDDLHIEADGSFEVIFSTEKPAGYQGNWLYLNPESEFILLRQFAYDWGHEEDVRTAIERLDTISLKAPMGPEETDRLLRNLFDGYVRRLSKLCLDIVQRTRNKALHHVMQLTDFSDLGNSDSWPQAYFECIYDLAADEVLILETQLPDRHVYWNVQVIDALWNQAELVYRQTSLNGRQARLDHDGRFRAVLSLEDPGVPNWLDTDGNLKGMLIGRWYRCSSHPVPTLQKVKLADLRNHLPAETPSVTPAERREVLRRRREGAQLRRRW